MHKTDFGTWLRRLLPAAALCAAYLLWFGNPFAIDCTVIVEPMEPTAEQLAQPDIRVEVQADRIVVWDYCQNPESGYTTVRATAKLSGGVLRVRAVHDTATDERKVTTNCVALTVTLPDHADFADIRKVEVRSSDRGGNRVTVTHTID